jgi:hypothetical protein
MFNELEDAFDRATNDTECRVIVHSGNGPCFCAGHDVTNRMNGAVLARGLNCHKGPCRDYHTMFIDRLGIGIGIIPGYKSHRMVSSPFLILQQARRQHSLPTILLIH